MGEVLWGRVTTKPAIAEVVSAQVAASETSAGLAQASSDASNGSAI